MEVHSISQYFRYPVNATLNNRIFTSFRTTRIHSSSFGLCPSCDRYIHTKYVSEAGYASVFRQDTPNLLDPLDRAILLVTWFSCYRLRFKYDGTCAETRFRLSAKRTSPFKSAGASVQSTTGSRDVRISGSNAGYIMFRGSVKSTGYPLHSPVSPSLSLPCVTVCHRVSTGLPRTNSVIKSLSTLVSASLVLCGLRIAWCQGSNRLGANCLKMEAQPTSES